MNRREQIRHVLVLLNVSDHFGGFGAFVEIDQLGWRKGWNSIFDERQVGKVDTLLWLATRQCEEVTSQCQ